MSSSDPAHAMRAHTTFGSEVEIAGLCGRDMVWIRGEPKDKSKFIQVAVADLDARGQEIAKELLTKSELPATTPSTKETE